MSESVPDDVVATVGRATRGAATTPDQWPVSQRQPQPNVEVEVEGVGEDQDLSLGEILNRPSLRAKPMRRVSKMNKTTMTSRRTEQVKRSKAAWNMAQKALRLLHPQDYQELLTQARLEIEEGTPPVPGGKMPPLIRDKKPGSK